MILPIFQTAEAVEGTAHMGVTQVGGAPPCTPAGGSGRVGSGEGTK